MVKFGLLAFSFGCAALSTGLNIAWHEARERRQPAMSAIVAGAIDLLALPPLWLAVEAMDIGFLVAGIIGGMAGSYIAVKMLGNRG